MNNTLLNYFWIFLLPCILNAQHNPLQGQDSLMLEFERHELLPESKKSIPELPKISLSYPKKSEYTYQSDSFSYQPQVRLPQAAVAGLQKPTVEKLYNGLLQVGLGSLLQPQILFDYHQGRTQNLDYGITLNYDGQLKEYVPYARQNKLHGSAHIGKHTDLWSFKSIIDFSQSHFRYFGDSSAWIDEQPLDTIKSSFQVFTWSNFVNYGKKYQGIYAFIQPNLSYYFDGFKNSEWNINLQPEVSYAWRIYQIGIIGEFAFASLKTNQASNSRMLLTTLPYLRAQKGGVTFRIGLRWNKTDTLQFTVPDLLLQYEFIPRSVQLMAGITGKQSLNTLTENKLLNPYLEPIFYQQSSITPWKFFAGAQMKISQITIQAYGYYQKTINQRIFYTPSNDTVLQGRYMRQAYFTALYDSNAKIYGVQSVMEWKSSKKHSVNLSLSYQQWWLNNFAYFFHQPSIRFDFWGKFYLRNRWAFQPEIRYFGKYALGFFSNNLLEEQKGIFLLNFQTTYFVKSNFYIFLRLENILNQRYYSWRYYQMPRFYGVIGASLRF